MMKTTHMTGGLLIGAIITNSEPSVGIAVATTCASVFGSLLPDIDIATSAMGRKVPWFSKLVKHRGMTHSMAFIAFVGMLIWLSEQHLFSKIGLDVRWIYGILWGMGSHLVLDMMNYRGIQIFWPISRWEYSFPFIRVKANGPWNTFFGILFFILSLILFLNHGFVDSFIANALLKFGELGRNIF